MTKMAALALALVLAPLTPFAQNPSPGQQCMNWHATTTELPLPRGERFSWTLTFRQVTALCR
jgi:hypothetical protein